MEIKVCRTTDWTEHEWETYTNSFNHVFEKKLTIDSFKKHYLSLHLGYAFHSLLLSNNQDVVGSITVIPCKYNRNDEDILIGLAVGVFIHQDYRDDPLMLRRMYKKLINLLEEENIVSVIAVPNATAYPYWKNVVKWKDVGRINYWMLPVRFGNVLKMTGLLKKLINIGSMSFCYILYVFSSLTSIIDIKGRSYKYSICTDDAYFLSKFNDKAYVKYEKEDMRYVYKIENEDGVKTCYLLIAEEGGRITSRALTKATRSILRNKVDIVLYVGKLGLFQQLFLKVPKKFEPKLLPLTCDLICKSETFKDMFDIKNWDFGLKNYDVR